MDTGIGDLQLAIGTENEQRWQLALHDATWKDYTDTPPIIKNGDRSPRRAVSLNLQGVAIVPGRLGGDDRHSRGSRAIVSWLCRICHAPMTGVDMAADAKDTMIETLRDSAR